MECAPHRGESAQHWIIEEQMHFLEVPEVVVLRLPMYVRALTQLTDGGADVVSSQQLGGLLQMTPAQIRKDLSYFGRFGKQGRGYNVEFLLRELRQILGLDREWSACLVGVGRLGRAIINYPGFAPEGFEVVAVFDSDPEQIGSKVGGLTVQPMSELGRAVENQDLDIGIVAVPASQAQSVIDQLVANKVGGILNYAPIAPQVPMNVVLRNIDPVLSLQSMTFYLQRDK
jgi:redox-sensing transcriptional repressor